MTLPLLGQAAVDRLTALNIATHNIHEALIAAAVARRNCTPDHPVSFPGTAAHAQAVYQLAQELRPGGWRRQDYKGIALTVNAERTVAVAIATGDENTGVERDVEPALKYPKGAASEELVESQQFCLFGGGPEMVPFDVPTLVVDGRRLEIFYLLIRFEPNGDRAFAELSRPERIEQGSVTRWVERIVLPVLDLRRPPGGMGAPEAPIAPIDVPVSRKAR